MTRDAQIAEIRKLLQSHTKEVTVSKETARAYLIKEGFYTPSGKLAPQYGGAKPQKPNRKVA